MGMTTHVMGFQPPDEEWQQMKAVFDVCTKAGIEIPDEVEDFFNYEDPKDSKGKEVNIEDAVTETSSEMRDGFEVDLSKLPMTVKVVRFFNAY